MSFSNRDRVAGRAKSSRVSRKGKHCVGEGRTDSSVVGGETDDGCRDLGFGGC